MAGGGGSPEVRIRLVADDAGATLTVEQLREALKGANEEHEKGEHHAEDLGKELLKVSLYTEAIKKGAELVSEAMHAAWEMGEKLADATVEAADESNQQVRTSAGLMSLMDRGAHSMGELRDYARGVREELAASGAAAGVSTATMEQMYDRVIERGNRSTESAKELTENMALVGKVVPQGMEGLAQGFNMMELGIVRARNPLVQLIASTGVLKGNAHDVAKEMTKMTPAEQVEKATEAIEKQAAILKAGGTNGLGMPTLPELKASFGNIREGFLEAVGEPMLQHVVPPLAELRDYLLAHKEEIAAYGDEIGTKFGALIDFIIEAETNIYKGVVNNWDKVSEEFHKIFGDWKAAWDYALEDTDAIRNTFQDIGTTITEVFAGVSKAVKAALELAMSFKDYVKGDAPGTTLANIQQKAVAGRAEQLGAGSQKDLDDAIAKYRDLAADAGKPAEEVDKYVEAMREQFAQRQEWGGQVKENVEAQRTDQISEAINSAVAQHDKAAESYVLNMLAESDAMTRALMTGAIQVNGGFEAFEKTIDDFSPELHKKIEAFRNTLAGKGITGQGPSVNFYGAQFTIKQDFRDQDPDRIIRDFKKDIGSAATARRQARVATAFGL